MSFNLQITFDGLCAFVPATSRRAMGVILINAVSSEPHDLTQHECSQAAHLPFVEIEEGDFKNEADLKDWPHLRRHDEKAVRFLDWEEVEILPPASNPPGDQLDIARGRRPGSNEPTPNTTTGEEQDFSWVPDLATIAPHCAEIDPHCLAPDPPRHLVLARLRLNIGKIFTGGFSETESQKQIWEFRPRHSGHEHFLSQAVASFVTYIREIPGDYAELVLRPFSGGKSTLLPLRPAPGTDDTVSIRVLNLPLEDAVGLPRLSPQPEDVDLHFGAVYKVSAHAPEHPLLPHLVSSPRISDGVRRIRGGTMICPSGTYRESKLV